jgi:hypothetical protein
MIATMNTKEQILYELAYCEVTKGWKVNKNASQYDVEARYKYFLGLIRRGSFTLEQLEESVFSRHNALKYKKQEKKHE